MNIDSLVEKARLNCESRGARFTVIREKVFRLLAQAQVGVGAYDLLEQLKHSEPNAKPATVYRALEFLSEQGFLHKIESTNAFLLCNHFDHHHAVQLLICDQCGSVQEIHSDLLGKELENLAHAKGFEISKQTIEAHGLCQQCQ